MSGGRVLIIDDEPELAAGLIMLLEDEGITASATSSPMEAAILMRRHRPDVVLVDLSMPSLSGERVVELTARHSMTDAHLVLFSGRGSAELSELTERLGVDGYISKGSDIHQVMRRIRFWIRERRMMQRSTAS